MLTNIASKIRELSENEVLICVVRGVTMGIMFVLIYVYLLHSDLTAAPEFIYNQF